MSLRLKLLLLGLATLVLPWAGCRYAREMESALRQGEAESLQGLSQTIAASLQGRTDLLYRETPPAPQALTETSPAVLPSAPILSSTSQRPTILSRSRCRRRRSSMATRRTGHARGSWTHFDRDERHGFAILTGVHERMLYVALRVHDEHALFDAPGNNPLDPATFGDRVWLGFEDPQGVQQQVFLAATGPGAVSARRIQSGEYGRQSARIEPRIRGAWQPVPTVIASNCACPCRCSARGSGCWWMIVTRAARCR